MSADATETTRTIELSGRQLERWEALRDQWTDDHLPAPTDEQMVKSLLDTVDAVDEGLYRDVGSDDRPTDSDGYTTRILCEPRDRDRFEEWAAASGLPGDVWELVGPDGEVVERHVFGESEDTGGDDQ